MREELYHMQKTTQKNYAKTIKRCKKDKKDAKTMQNVAKTMKNRTCSDDLFWIVFKFSIPFE